MSAHQGTPWVCEACGRECRSVGAPPKIRRCMECRWTFVKSLSWVLPASSPSPLPIGGAFEVLPISKLRPTWERSQCLVRGGTGSGKTSSVLGTVLQEAHGPVGYVNFPAQAEEFRRTGVLWLPAAAYVVVDDWRAASSADARTEAFLTRKLLEAYPSCAFLTALTLEQMEEMAGSWMWEGSISRLLKNGPPLDLGDKNHWLNGGGS